MKPPVDEIRIGIRSKDVLLRLKRRTGLGQWNHLCRIAYAASLSDSSHPSAPSAGEAAIRMEWKTFAGHLSEELVAINSLRARVDGVDTSNREALAQNFRAHLERGIDLIADARTADDLLSRVMRSKS
jgi:DNA sulfur modification protein DndE